MRSSSALVHGARDVAAPGSDPDTGAGVLDVAHAAALLAGGDHAGPRVTVNARWSQDSARLGLVLSGVAHERGGGTGAGVTATAFIALRGVPVAPFALTAAAARRDLGDARRPRPRAQGRRLVDGRHSLFVRARDAAGNWGPVRAVALPIDRARPSIRVSGGRRGDVVSALLHVRERGSGLVLLRYRLETGGRTGRGTSSRPPRRRT